MNSPTHPSMVLASAATGVVEHIARNGGDPASILSTTSIQPEDLNDPINELSLEQFCHLFTESFKLYNILRAENDSHHRLLK